MKFTPWLFIGVLVVGFAKADTYAGLVSGMAFVKADSATFRPWTAGIVAGFRGADGIGTELDLRTGITDDEKADVTSEIDLQASGYLTYSGKFNRRAFLTLGVGYATTRLDSSLRSSGFPGKQSFNGPAFLARLEEQMLNYPNIVLSLSYQHFYLDGDVSLSGASFGVAYGF